MRDFPKLGLLLDQAAEDGDVARLQLVKSEQGWVCSIPRKGNGNAFIVRIEDTPAAALDAALTEATAETVRRMTSEADETEDYSHLI